MGNVRGPFWATESPEARDRVNYVMEAFWKTAPMWVGGRVRAGAKCYDPPRPPTYRMLPGTPSPGKPGAGRLGRGSLGWPLPA